MYEYKKNDKQIVKKTGMHGPVSFYGSWSGTEFQIFRGSLEKSIFVLELVDTLAVIPVTCWITYIIHDTASGLRNNGLLISSLSSFFFGSFSSFPSNTSGSRPKKVADIIDAFNKSRKANDAGESGQNGKMTSCKKDPISGNATTNADVSNPPRLSVSFWRPNKKVTNNPTFNLKSH